MYNIAYTSLMMLCYTFQYTSTYAESIMNLQKSSQFQKFKRTMSTNGKL